MFLRQFYWYLANIGTKLGSAATARIYWIIGPNLHITLPAFYFQFQLDLELDFKFTVLSFIDLTVLLIYCAVKSVARLIKRPDIYTLLLLFRLVLPGSDQHCGPAAGNSKQRNTGAQYKRINGGKKTICFL